jgi:hypothetical protein
MGSWDGIIFFGDSLTQNIQSLTSKKTVFFNAARCQIEHAKNIGRILPKDHLKDRQDRDQAPKIHVSQMGLSENSVALHPMVNDHYPY